MNLACKWQLKRRVAKLGEHQLHKPHEYWQFSYGTWPFLYGVLNGVQEAGGSIPLTHTKKHGLAVAIMKAAAILLQ